KAVFRGVGMYFSPRPPDSRSLEWSLVFEAMRLRYRLASKPSVASVDAADQRRLFFACALESEVSEQLHITIRYIGKSLCRGACVRCGHIRHAIMRNSFLNINRIEMRGWSRCLRAAALVDRNINQHTAALHLPQHRARD